MIASPDIQMITALLHDAAFKSLETPIEIGGIKFEIPAGLIGGDKSLDLVLIVDSISEDERRILRKIEGVARALDVAGSKRTLTTVISGPRPSATILEAMSKVSRVLPIGTVKAEDMRRSLENWLAVLLPLKIPDASPDTTAPAQELLNSANDLPGDIISLITIARDGKDAVAEAINDFIIESIGTDLDEEVFE